MWIEERVQKMWFDDLCSFLHLNKGYCVSIWWTLTGMQVANSWQVHYTAEGRPYYHDPSTGVTQWEVPAGTAWSHCFCFWVFPRIGLNRNYPLIFSPVHEIALSIYSAAVTNRKSSGNFQEEAANLIRSDHWIKSSEWLCVWEQRPLP